MLAVLPADPQDPGTVRLGELPDPEPGRGEVLLRVRACALNRADLLQMRGGYPPPPGESEIPGLECAGEIEALGPGVAGWATGDPVIALLAGGGQAERVAVPAGQLMPLPPNLDFAQGAALPEVALTAWTNLVEEGGLRAGQTVLITAAASGVGSFAVQMARELGARVLVAGRSRERLEPLRELGAGATLLLDDLPGPLLEVAAGGVDLVVDLAGGADLDRRLACLRPQGRLVLVGLLAGTRAEIDLARLLRSRLEIRGSVLRSRPRDEKARLVRDFQAWAGERLADSRVQPVIHRIRPFAEIAEVYREMQEGGVLGKLVLTLP